MKKNKRKKIFNADIASGLNGCNFGLSPCVESIVYNNRRNTIRFPFWAFTSNGKFGREWIREDEYRRETEKVWRLVNRPGGLKNFSNLLKGNIRRAENLKIYVWKLLPHLKKMNSEQLLEAYGRFIKKYNLYFGLGVVTFIYESVMSEKFLTLLVKNGRPVSSLQAILGNSYRSFMIDSEEKLRVIKREKNKEKKEKIIAQYLANFYFIQSDYYVGPIIDCQYVLDKVKDLKETKAKIAPKKKIHLDAEETIIARLLQLTEALRDTRKKTNQIGLYCLFRFLDEASRRSHLSLKLCRRAFWFEYKNLLKSPAVIAKTLKKRLFASFIFEEGKCYYLSYNALRERTAIVSSSTLTGVPASPGYIKGRAKIILGRDHFSKIRCGDILVSTMTRPEFLPAMKKAGAIITEEGGITSHAAVIARELKIPCIVGIKNLTRLVRDGDLVDVNATHGKVDIIKKVK